MFASQPQKTVTEKFDQVGSWAHMEKQFITKALDDNNGNRTHTCKAIGIGVRTLQRKLKTWGMQEYKLNSKGVRFMSHGKWVNRIEGSGAIDQ